MVEAFDLAKATCEGKHGERVDNLRALRTVKAQQGRRRGATIGVAHSRHHTYMTPVRIVAALLIGLVLIAAGAVIVPAAWHSMQLRLAADDPVELADLRLKGGVLTQNGSGLNSPQRWPPRFPRKG